MNYRPNMWMWQLLFWFLHFIFQAKLSRIVCRLTGLLKFEKKENEFYCCSFLSFQFCQSGCHFIHKGLHLSSLRIGSIYFNAVWWKESTFAWTHFSNVQCPGVKLKYPIVVFRPRNTFGCVDVSVCLAWLGVIFAVDHSFYWRNHRRLKSSIGFGIFRPRELGV